MHLHGVNRCANVIESMRWDDMMVGGLAVALGSSSPGLGTFGPSGNLQTYIFNGSGPAQSVYFTIQLSHQYQQGTDIYMHVHWAPVDTAAGDVKWNLEYTWATINATFAAPSTISVVQAASGTAWQHQVISFGAITGTGKNISSVLVCRLFRNSADGQDTYGSGAALLGADAHYMKDAFGSRQEFIK